MMMIERWHIDVNVEPSCNDDEYIIAISLDGPGNCAFHTLILTEKEAQELDAGLRQAFDEIKEARRAAHTVNGRVNSSARAACAGVSSMADGAARCARCLGSGKVADDADGAPWLCWEGLPEESKLAVTLGLVKPITCPDCGGKGGGK